jgi:hypothetical protein
MQNQLLQEGLCVNEYTMSYTAHLELMDILHPLLQRTSTLWLPLQGGAVMDAHDVMQQLMISLMPSIQHPSLILNFHNQLTNDGEL